MKIDDTRIFVKVVQNASFSKAAEILKLPKSTVSRTISRLEKESGTKLLMRTTRSLTLTPAGRAFFEVCAGPMQILEDARRSLHDQDSVIRGLVRITAPEDLGSGIISRSLAQLSQEIDGLQFELLSTNDVVDLVREGFDLAIRLGRLAPSRLKSTRLGDVKLILVAADSYFKAHSKIRSVSDLQSHSCLSHISWASGVKWSLRSENRVESLIINPKIVSNQMTSLIAMARQGAGVALVPQYLCDQIVKRGELVRVLPGWFAPDVPCTMVMPTSTGASSRLRLVADRLKSDLRQVLQGK